MYKYVSKLWCKDKDGCSSILVLKQYLVFIAQGCLLVGESWEWWIRHCSPNPLRYTTSQKRSWKILNLLQDKRSSQSCCFCFLFPQHLHLNSTRMVWKIPMSHIFPSIKEVNMLQLIRQCKVSNAEQGNAALDKRWVNCWKGVGKWIDIYCDMLIYDFYIHRYTYIFIYSICELSMVVFFLRRVMIF